MQKKIRQAVSIIFQFENTVFSIVRQNYLKAFPGYTAFPGGKVDKEDEVSGDLASTLLNALKREAFEELSIDIDKALERGAITSIEQIAKATTPDFNPHRYETYFYLLKCSSHLTFDVDQSEVKEGDWHTASSIVGEFYQGKRLMVKPVLEVYKKLSLKDEPQEFYDYDKDRKVDFIPQIENIHGVKQLMPLSNTVPPATRTNCFVIGDDSKTIIDPSPKNKDEFDLLMKALASYNLDKIFITHHHKDHHQFAPDIARKFCLPIAISKDSFDRINKIYGEDYFRDIQIKFLKENDILTTWLKRDVIIYEIPGHDEGHLGIAPSSLEWFIVGDLFQGIGTVVVGGDEGDMQKYMQSLQKVIDLKPSCVIPSHGIPLGGTSILEKTYHHRVMREEQVLDLFKQGHDIEKILSTIYFDIPQNILKYARANIQSHLDKLKAEGKL